MNLITPKFEIISQKSGLDEMFKHIERAGRTCYRSEDKITEGSAEKFVERMKSLGHGSVLEHGTIYLAMPNEITFTFLPSGWRRYSDNRFSKIVSSGELNGEKKVAVTSNYRVLLQGDYSTWDEAVKNGFNKNWLDDLQYQCEPTEFHEKRVTVRFTTDIGISREFNRHRVNSISEESTRYCNYSKGKFGGEISVVPPIRARRDVEEKLNHGLRWFNGENRFFDILCCEASNIAKRGESEGSNNFLNDIETYLFAVLSAQWSYMRLTNVFGWSAQEARSILPLCTATELVHTAFVSDWENFFNLRCDSHAHPMAQELAIPLRKEFVKRGLIKE